MDPSVRLIASQSISGGATDGPAMTALSSDLTEILTGPFSSAIDHVYVTGHLAGRLSSATVVRDGAGGGFGSAHLPVVVTLDP